MDVFRTPDSHFEDLPDYPWVPRYSEHEGLRLAYLDEGDGPVVVLLHGEPTWSYLWRHVIPPLLEAGYRCVVPDLIGFGRSDKPTAIGDYSYDSHTAAIAALLAGLELTEATLVVHDWGGPIGMRVFVEHPAWFERLVVARHRVLHRRAAHDGRVGRVPGFRRADRGSARLLPRRRRQRPRSD